MKKRNIIIVVLAAVLLVGGYFGYRFMMFDSDGEQVVQKQVRILGYDFFNQELLAYEGIDKDGFSYLKEEDFIDLMTYVNNYLALYKNTDAGVLDHDNQTVNLEHKAKLSLGIELFNKEFFNHFEYTGDEYLGEANLSFTNEFLPWVKYRGTTYIPIDVIRYQIFNTAQHLIKYNDTDYYWMGRSPSGILFYYPEENRFDEFTKREMDYSTSLKMLSKYTGVEFDELTSNDYSEYVIEATEGYLKSGDSHFYVVPFDEISEDDRDELRSMWREHRGENPLTSEGVDGYHDAYTEMINDDTILLDIHTFSDDADFRTGVSKFFQILAANKDIKNIIIDVRYNGGGSLANELYLVNGLTNKDFSYNYVYECGEGAKCIKKQNFKLKEPKDTDYNFTVLVNEFSGSASLDTTYHMKDVMGATVIGIEPEDKKAQPVVTFQFPDNTVATRTDPLYKFAEHNGVPFDEQIIVDVIKTQEEVEAYLDELREQ